MTDYYTGTAHGKRLSEAMDEFEKALTKRWREVFMQTILEGSDDYPTQFKREATSHDAQMWPYWSEAANYHLGYGGAKCAYAEWVENDQKGDLSAVKCTGETGSSPHNPNEDEYGNAIPANIDCGMGRNLELIGNWAGAERDAIYEALPLFDNHDLPALNDAYDTFVDLGHDLGLNLEGSGKKRDQSFDRKSDDDLPAIVDALSGENGDGQDWWAGWTGLAASRAKSGFFASVVPTLNNQAGISGSLANLYSLRASIIEAGRNNGLYWTQWAASSLAETEITINDSVTGWKVVQGVGGAISITGGWSGVGAGVGASVTLLGFLGENLLSGAKSEDYKYGLEEAMGKFLDEVDKINKDVGKIEHDYGNEVRELRTTIWDIHSFNLELYDLTENSADGDGRGEDGYTADVDDILRIGEACFAAGEQYGELVTLIKKTEDADKHLSDENGEPTSHDTALLETRDQLKGFLETAQGRYLMAGDQVKDSAEAYANQETDQKGAFDRTMLDWQDEGIGEYGDADPKDLADDTDRGNYPGSATDVNPDGPGEDDGEDYITDENP